MRDARFTWFQIKPDVFEPCLKDCFRFLYPCFRRMKYHKIVCIADEVWFPFSIRKGLYYMGFHAMQRNISGQRRNDPTLRRSAGGFFKDPIVHNSRFEPCFDDSSEGRVGVE